MKYSIGIDIGGTKTAYGLFDEDRNMVARHQHPSDSTLGNEAFFTVIADNVRILCADNNISLSDLKGVGVGMPSFIRFDEGRILKTVNLTNLKDFAARDFLQDLLGVPVVLDNDTHVAALAEYKLGAGRGLKHMMYTAVSTGIASGIIINGELFRGSHGWAGESGHMIDTVDGGLLCGCGNSGCYMSHVSGRHMPKRLELRLQEHPESILRQEKELNGEALLRAYEAGDAVALAEVDYMAKHLAACVYNIYQLLNIDVFVFGGGLTHFGDALFGRMRKYFDEYDHIKFPVEFRFAELKKDFGIIGSAELIR